MPRFESSYWIDAPVQAVAAFHYDPSALKKLTPPPIIAQYHNIEPLAEGSLADFTLWFGPLPVRWLAVHSDVRADGFTDTQQRGLMQSWRHQHGFLEEAGGTRLTDTIDYVYPAGLKGLLARLLLNTPLLKVMFAYRRTVLQRTFRKS